MEIGWAPFSTFTVNQRNREVDLTDFLLRKLEVIIDTPRHGRFWLGQGSMASDGSAENDLSGTSVAGYSAVGSIAGGQFFRFPDGQLSEARVFGGFRNFDALRKLRVRYDTPSFHGFTMGAPSHLVASTPSVR